MNTARILVVEDDATIRMHVAAALGEAGYDVTTASNGAEALDILHGGAPRPQVMIVDLMMPVLTGRALLATCAADPELAAVRAIVTSASSAGASAAARDGYRVLRKPFTIERLLIVVAREVRGCDAPTPPSEREQLEDEIASLTAACAAAGDEMTRQRIQRALHEVRNRLTGVSLSEQMRRRRAAL